MSETIKILISYDGSDCADIALTDLGSAGFPEKGVEAHIVSVAEVWLPPNTESGADTPDLMTEGLRKKLKKNLQIVEDSKQLAEKAAERIRRDFPDWQVHAESTYGSPSWEILARAKKYKSDLIVVGSQGLSMLQRLWLGSVSQKIVTEARCSVRIVRGDGSKPDVIRLILAFDGTDGSEQAAAAIEKRRWPGNTEICVVIVEDSETVLEAFAVEDDTNEIEKRGEEIVKRLEGKGLKASLDILHGNPKELLINRASDFGANCIFVGATEFSGPVERFLLGSVSSAVATRATCSVEVIR